MTLVSILNLGFRKFFLLKTKKKKNPNLVEDLLWLFDYYQNYLTYRIYVALTCEHSIWIEEISKHI